MTYTEEDAQELLKTHTVDVSHNHKPTFTINAKKPVSPELQSALEEVAKKAYEQINQGNPGNELIHYPPEKMERLKRKIGTSQGNKYHAVKTWSTLCNRQFDSKAECRRGEELYLREKAGEIHNLKYQVKYVLCDKPLVTYTADFTYIDKGRGIIDTITEDVKGVMTRDTRTKLAWLKQQQGIDVVIVK